MTSQFDIISQAMQNLDFNAVTSFNDSTKESLLAASRYETVRNDELSSHHWNFNRSFVELSQYVDSVVENTLWEYRYALPPNYLATISVYDEANDPIIYLEEDDSIYTNTSRAFLSYRKITPEGNFPAWFTELLICRLTYEFADPMGVDEEIAKRTYSKYINQLDKCRRIDAQSQIMPQLHNKYNSSWWRARRAGG